MNAIIDTFHIDWKIIIAQAVNFAIVFTVLYVYALKPLSKLMAERSQKIEKGIQDAKVNAETLLKTKEEYEKEIARARAEADKLFEKGKKEAEANKAKMLEEARTEVGNMVQNGKQVLEAEKAKMIADAKREIVDLTLRATEKLLGEKPDSGFSEKAAKELNNL